MIFRLIKACFFNASRLFISVARRPMLEKFLIMVTVNVITLIMPDICHILDYFYHRSCYIKLEMNDFDFYEVEKGYPYGKDNIKTWVKNHAGKISEEQINRANNMISRIEDEEAKLPLKNKIGHYSLMAVKYAMPIVGSMLGVIAALTMRGVPPVE